MPIAVVCPCGTRFDVPDHYAGRNGNCTSCKAPLVVPGGQPSGQVVSASAFGRAAVAPVAVAAPAPPGGSDEHPAAGGGPFAGKTLGQYTLKRQVGSAKSTVYQADSSGGAVAIKVLPKGVVDESPTAGKRFLREARALFGLNHPNLVRCLDAGEELGTYYLVMEYFEGRTLTEVLQAKGGTLPEREALTLASAIAKGLDCLGSKNLVHRNLKPRHVLVAADGGVKVVGMGLVRSDKNTEDVQVTGAGMIVGTPQYMAPEQALGTGVDQRSDLFSLGTTLYELLCGSPPFHGKVPSRVVAQLVREPCPPIQTRNPDVSAATSAVLERLLQKSPDDRYGDANELVKDLEAILAGRLVAGLPPGLSARAAAGASSGAAAATKADSAKVQKLTLIVGVLVVAVVVLGVAVAVMASG
jgi:eukaryotic-like serine/threonine-protein kinase